MALLFGKPKKMICGTCGAKDFAKINRNIYKCLSCDTVWDFGFSDEEQKRLDEAQSDLKRQEFEAAEEKFYDIISDFPDNHEAYWGYVCARYGIKHEEDYDGKIIPTCCLDTIESFKTDKDFLKAVSLAPKEISEWYLSQADYIERISKKWREEAEKEQPYDIFICFKDSDKENGVERTKDSYDASDIYAFLTDKGYRVFFSRISLATKTGEKYEPFIFSALKSAKVMIVFGSSVKYLSSTWLKNEWRRYVKRISLGEKQENSLVVVYNGFNVNELPSMLSSRQCLDFNDRKFYYNLDAYLGKFFSNHSKTVKSSTPKSDYSEEVASSDADVISYTPITATKKKKKIFDELHVHDYSITEVVPASCITRGYTIHRCECGDEYRDSMTPLAPHVFKLKETIRPSCEKAGKEIYVCSVCGDKDEKPIPATGHSFGEWIITEEPECETEGEKAKQCKICGAVVKEKLAATGHSFGEWIIGKRPTCEETGEEKSQCKTCGKIETRAISATGHSFTGWKLSGDGKTETRYCQNCGKEETRKTFFKVGDIITLGTYPQGAKGEVKPIEWQILDVKNGQALVISKYALDCKAFNDTRASVTWGSCTLRKWLNDDFYDKAFNGEDKAKITTTTVTADKNPSYNTPQGNATQDKVFLLSVKEVDSYCKSDADRNGNGTDYCYKQGSYKDASNGNCWWWLRSSGSDSGSAANVSCDGSVYNRGYSVNYKIGAVRPAMWINIYNKNEVNEPPKPASLQDISKRAKVGDIITLGTYPQGAKEEVKPIEWRVLDVKNGQALVISEYALDCKPFNDIKASVTWETCTLRKWLNDDFYDKAFNGEDKAKITTTTVTADKNPSYNTPQGSSTHDKVFLLSVKETEKLFLNATERECEGTAYCHNRGAYQADNGCCWWWLRSLGDSGSHAADVISGGRISFSGRYVYDTIRAVRPAMRIKL